MVVIKECPELYKIVGYRPEESEEVIVTASDGYRWNGWVQVYINDRLVYSSFKTGIRWEVFEHIITCPTCSSLYNKEEIAEIRAELTRMNIEWAEVTGNKKPIFLPIIFGWE